MYLSELCVVSPLPASAAYGLRGVSFAALRGALPAGGFMVLLALADGRRAANCAAAERQAGGFR